MSGTPRKRRPLRPIQRRRLELDLTQQELADKVGVTIATISKWETGTGIPEAGYYGKLAKALGITAREVVDLVAQSQEPAEAGTGSK